MASGFLQAALEAQDRRDHHTALAYFRQVLADEPRNWVGHTGLGNSLRALGQLDDAIAACTRGVEVAGGSLPAWTQLGLAYQAKGLWAEARLCLGRACHIEPASADAHNNLAALELLADDPAAAELAARQALTVAPGHARAAINLGRARKEQGALGEAIALYQRALGIEPGNVDAGWNLGLALLQEERWEEGWPRHELRSAIPEAPAGVPRWDGRPLDGGRLLVQAEKGLGDTIHFARYVRLLKAQAGAGRVVVECQPALRRLLVRCDGVDDVVPRGDALPAVDACVAMMSLPLLLRSFDPTLTATAHYLTAEPALVARWKAELRRRQGNDAPAIGIVWQGNPAYQADHRRSLPLATLVPVIERARQLGFAVYSLQKGPGSEQLRGLPARLAVDELGSALDAGRAMGSAFVDTAAVMANLDVVITSDTAIPHLGGALGVPVWLLLAHLPDWRWGRRGQQTPWYPSLKLHRQPHPGDWAAVMVDVCAALPHLERKRS
ncbi:MAG TPA: tetratricopeptide repeat-containing glycosyltransferase family protein [Polyangia bacterium]|nr:tetratricopeptide repeat-containing glycosyltransferase family protein [Polyangia bacterium]